MPLILFGRKLPPAEPSSDPALRGEDWQQANPKRIRRALDRALALPSGGWYVVDGCRAFGASPRKVRVAGRDLVVWRGRDGLHVAPEACPHMEAPLSSGHVEGNDLVCPWHGLRLGKAGHGAWRPLPVYDDGVLLWVRLDEPGQEPTDAPFLPPRPARFIDGVIRVEAHCSPANVVENRLDPWHGAWFHPYAFARLKVTELNEDMVRVRVAKRLLGPLCMEVDATFHCPDPRSIVMTIVAGEGVGSVVETHATPIDEGHTAIVEATIATSDRYQFRLAEIFAPLVRPFVNRSARRLWKDDAAYAEARFAAQSGDTAPKLATVKGPKKNGKSRARSVASRD